MQLPFSKYHGAGNDFILIDNQLDTFSFEDSRLITHLCDRRFGIGADGVLSIENDLIVRIFNADGSAPAFCGNGIRCAFDYLSRLLNKPQLQLKMGGRSFLCRRKGDAVAVDLGVPQVVHWPIRFEGMEAYVIDTGVPHALLFVEDLVSVDVAEQGKRVRWASCFAPAGVNATFVRVDAKACIAVRTYERGVEAETLACGSGAAAAAWAARHLCGLDDRIGVKTRRSWTEEEWEESLRFSFTGDAIEMIGPAVCVFSGTCVF